jgi:hypothetical protein
MSEKINLEQAEGAKRRLCEWLDISSEHSWAGFADRVQSVVAAREQRVRAEERARHCIAICVFCAQLLPVTLTTAGRWEHTVEYADRPGCYAADCDAWQIRALAAETGGTR